MKLIQKIAVFWFRKSGWKFLGPMPKGLKNCIIVAGPHSSKMDFLLSLAICSLTHFRTDILVHSKYFRFPVKQFLYDLGARPYWPTDEYRMRRWVQKNIRKRTQYSALFVTNLLGDERFILRTHWYDIAAESKVPIVLVGIDHKKKNVKIHSYFFPSFSRERDLEFVRNFFKYYYD